MSSPPILFNSLPRQVIWVLLFVCLLLPSTSTHAQGTASISGRTIGAEGEPVANVYIYFYIFENGGWSQVPVGSGEYEFKTDQNGEYTFTGLRAGTYRLKAAPSSQPGSQYWTEYYQDKESLNTANDVIVAEGATLTGYDFLLQRDGVVKGTVLDTENNPIAGVPVSVWVNPLGWSYNVERTVSTDSSGRFSFSVSQNNRIWLSFASPTGGAYVYEYYDDKPNIDSADAIQLAPNETLDVTAVLKRTKSLKGTVTDNTGAPFPNIEVDLARWSGSDWMSTDRPTILTDAAGNYSFPYLQSGQYRLHFRSSLVVAEYYDDQSAPENATPIDLSNADGPEIVIANVALTRRGRIIGTVTNASGAPIDDIKVSLYRFEDADGTENDRWEPVKSDNSDADGTYSLVVPSAGDYRLGFEGGEDFITEYYDNVGTVESATSITVGGDDLITVDVQLEAKDKGKFAGTVTSTNGQPLSEVNVYAYPPGSKGPVGYAKTDEAGNYQLAVDSGIDVVLGFYHDTHNAEYYNDQPTADTATVFTAPLNETVPNLNAELVPGPLVKGTITDNSGALLPNIQIEVVKLIDYAGGSDEHLHATLQTDAKGHFSIRLASGRYKFHITDPTDNHVEAYFPPHAENDLQPFHFLAPGEDLILDTELPIVPSISGRILGLTGQPGYAVAKLIKRTQEDDAQSSSCCSTIAQASSDPAGTYRLWNIEPGEYYVFFETDPFQSNLDEYYPNQLTVDTAFIFTMTPTSIITGIDAVITNPDEVDADFIATPRSGSNPLTVTFSEYSMGPVEGREWDFGDGTTSSEVNPSHTYEESGVYTVTLTVTGAKNRHSKVKGSYIALAGSPIANLEIEHSNPGNKPESQPVVGQTIYFSATAGGSNIQYLWDFGDESVAVATTATGRYVQHAYIAPGDYTVTLTARNGDDEKVATMPVTVGAVTQTYVTRLPKVER